MAITDHGTVRGIPEAIAYSTGKIEVIAGIELSCDEPTLGMVDIHILGLGIDYKNKDLLTWLTKAKEASIYVLSLTIKGCFFPEEVIITGVSKQCRWGKQKCPVLFLPLFTRKSFLKAYREK